MHMGDHANHESTPPSNIKSSFLPPVGDLSAQPQGCVRWVSALCYYVFPRLFYITHTKTDSLNIWCCDQISKHGVVSHHNLIDPTRPLYSKITYQPIEHRKEAYWLSFSKKLFILKTYGTHARHEHLSKDTP